jgi:hypothetical protein
LKELYELAKANHPFDCNDLVFVPYPGWALHRERLYERMEEMKEEVCQKYPALRVAVTEYVDGLFKSKYEDDKLAKTLTEQAYNEAEKVLVDYKFKLLSDQFNLDAAKHKL